MSWWRLQPFSWILVVTKTSWKPTKPHWILRVSAVESLMDQVVVGSLIWIIPNLPLFYNSLAQSANWVLELDLSNIKYTQIIAGRCPQNWPSFLSIPKIPQVYSAYYRLLLTLVAHAVCALKSTPVVCCVMCAYSTWDGLQPRARPLQWSELHNLVHELCCLFFILKRLENKHYRHSMVVVTTESQYTIRYWISGPPT